MNYIEVGSKEHKRATFGITIGSTITFAIMYSPQPLISLYSKQYNISPETASLSISLTTIALAVSLFFVSILAGGLNRKKLMSRSLLLSSCLTILTAFIHSFTIFLLVRFFEGIAVAGFPSIAMTYLNEEFSPKDIGRIIGYYVAGTAIGGLFGRIVIGALTDLVNWHTAFFIQGIISLLGSIWFFIYLPQSNNFIKKQISLNQWTLSLKKALFNKKLFSMYASAFLLMGAYITILDYIGYPLTRAPYYLSQTVFGFLFTVNLFGIWSSILFGKLADRYSRRKIIGLAITIFVIGVLLTLDKYLMVKIIGVAGVAFGFFAAHSIASSWTGLLAAKEHKGQASSFYLFFYYMGSSLLGWLGGIILNYFNWNGLICYVCILLIGAIAASVKPWDAVYKAAQFKSNLEN